MLRLFVQYKCRYASLKHPERWSQNKCWVAIGHSSFSRFLLVRMCGTFPFTPPRQKMSSCAFWFWGCGVKGTPGTTYVSHSDQERLWTGTTLSSSTPSGWSWTCWKIRKVRLPLKGPLSHCWEIGFRKNKTSQVVSSKEWITHNRDPGHFRVDMGWGLVSNSSSCLLAWLGRNVSPVGLDSSKRRKPLTPGPLFKSLCVSLWCSECGSQSGPPSAWST